MLDGGEHLFLTRCYVAHGRRAGATIAVPGGFLR
jgi:hypothetical protein